MIVLYVLLAIVALIVLLLSVRLSLAVDYEEILKIKAKWLFITLDVFPAKKKPPKEKAAKAEEVPPEQPSEEKPKEPKARSPFLIFYDNEGVGGVLNILQNTSRALGGMFKSVLRHFIIRELFIDLRICGDDAADTAIRYGKVCEKAFPALGAVCSGMKVKEYDMDIYPDFLGKKDKAEYHLVFSIRPVFVVGAGIVLLVRLLFKVALKFLLSARPKKENVEAPKEKSALAG